MFPNAKFVECSPTVSKTESVEVISKMETPTLTEQWKRGELEKDKYWVKYRSGKIDIWELSEGTPIESRPEIVEVLAPVPSYEKWQKVKELLKECRKEYTGGKEYTDTDIVYMIDEVLK